MVERSIRNKAKRARTRTLLIEAAKVVFTESGFEQTRIADVTAAADLSVGAFYEHFKNKDEIFLEIVKEVNRDLRDDIGSFRGAWSEGLPLKERIKQASTIVFDFFDEYPYCIPIIAMGGSGSDSVMGRSYAILMEDVVEALLRYSQAGVKLKQLRDLDPETTIMAIMGAFSGVANLYLNGALPRDQMIDALTEFIAHGILVSPPD